MFGEKWICNPESYFVVFEENSFKKLLKDVLDNCFLKIGSIVFQGVINIPMGFDSSPFKAALPLFNYGEIWIWKTKRKVLSLNRKFSNMF